MNEKVFKKRYFTIIYSFEEVLEIICTTQKNQEFLSPGKSPKMVHFDVDLRINIFELL